MPNYLERWFARVNAQMQAVCGSTWEPERHATVIAHVMGDKLVHRTVPGNRLRTLCDRRAHPARLIKFGPGDLCHNCFPAWAALEWQYEISTAVREVPILDYERSNGQRVECVRDEHEFVVRVAGKETERIIIFPWRTEPKARDLNTYARAMAKIVMAQDSKFPWPDAVVRSFTVEK